MLVGFVRGVDSPFFSSIVLSKSLLFPSVSGGFLERRIPGKNGEGTPRFVVSLFRGVQLPPLKPWLGSDNRENKGWVHITTRYLPRDCHHPN